MQARDQSGEHGIVGDTLGDAMVNTMFITCALRTTL